MRELYLSELRRFRKAALLAAPLHLVGLFLILRFRDFMHAHASLQLLLMFVYVVLTFGFGLYQFGTYRQPNRWIWLMHRPLEQRQISIAVCGASATLIAAVIGLPGLLALAGNQLLTTRVVDAYHYAVVLHGTLFAFAAWLCAGYVMLSHSKLASAVVVLPFMFMFRVASVYQLLALDLICIALLGAMLSTAMKANRHAPPRGAPAVLATALPLLLASYFVLAAGGGMVYQYAAIVHGSHPLNTEVPPAGGFTEAVRSKPDARMLLGLAHSRDPRAETWRAQAKGNTAPVHVFFDSYPVRNQAGPKSNHNIVDPENGLSWTYSQDAQAFIGRSQFTGARKAVLPADDLPILYPASQSKIDAFSRHSAATYDSRAMGWQETFRVPQDEIILGQATAGESGRKYFVTTKRVVVAEGDAPMRESFGIPLPGKADDLSKVDVTHVPDGVLLSFLFGKRMIDGVPGGDQLILHIDSQGRATQVARRALAHDFPTLFEHKDWWISPVLHAVESLPPRVLTTPEVFAPIPLDIHRPATVWMAALCAALLSTALGWWWLRGTQAGSRRRAGWIAACVALGPPALITLAVMERRHQRLPQSSQIPFAATHPA